MSTQDTRTARIGRAIELSGRGEGDQARQLLTELWDELEDGNDVVQRCAVAHHLADVQDDPRDELKWDLRALQAADDLPPEALLRAGATASIAGLYPSLHLNLGEDYRKVGDLSAARRHLQLGQQASAALGDDGYSQMIRRGLDGLAARLETG